MKNGLRPENMKTIYITGNEADFGTVLSVAATWQRKDYDK